MRREISVFTFRVSVKIAGEASVTLRSTARHRSLAAVGSVVSRSYACLAIPSMVSSQNSLMLLLVPGLAGRKPPQEKRGP